MSGMRDVEFGKYVGDAISRVCRLRYQVGDEVVPTLDGGAVELTFSSGATLYGESGPDGDSLRVKDTPWVDPFAGPLSPENEEYVRTSGKWVRHDVSGEPPFDDLIGRKVFDVAPMAGST